jgi:hypothetical protein
LSHDPQFGPFPFPPWPLEGESVDVAASRRERTRYCGGGICDLLFILLATHLGEPEARQFMVARIEKLAGHKRAARKPSHDDFLLQVHAAVLEEIKVAGGKPGRAPRLAAERIHFLYPRRLGPNPEAIQKHIRRLLKTRRDKRP